MKKLTYEIDYEISKPSLMNLIENHTKQLLESVS